MLVVLASVAAALRIISEAEERERPIVGERASRGRVSDVIKVIFPSLCSTLSSEADFHLQYSTMIL